MALPNRSFIIARYTLLLAGIEKHIPGPVVLAGASYTQTALSQPFQSWLSAVSAVATAKAQYHAAVLAEQTLLKTCQALWLLLETYARLTYGSDTQTLADLGYVAEQHTDPSPATKVLAAAKAAATRAARHTLGKKQKAKITGTTPATPPLSLVPAVPAK